MLVLADVLTSANAWNSEQPLLTYTVPPELLAELHAGQLVAVPYGDRLVEGATRQAVERAEKAEVRTPQMCKSPGCPENCILQVFCLLMSRELPNWLSFHVLMA